MAADYSVFSSGFTGGLINVVTKSGTNDFSGSAFYFRQDEDYIGNVSDGAFVDAGEFEEEEYGFTLGGPIIKDRAFFFVSYEEFESASPSSFAGADISNEVNDPAFFDEFSRIVSDAYGFDAGSRPLTLNTPETAERLLAKFDLNITEDHRASVTYQNVKEDNTSTGSTSLDSAFYGTPQEVEAYSFQVFSDWTDSFSTQVRVGYKTFDRLQNCNAGRSIGEINLLNTMKMILRPTLTPA